MSVMAFLGAVVAAIKAIPIVDKWFGALIAVYITSMNGETQTNIVDAAALGARAQNDDQRYAASKAWMDALSRNRIVP